MEMFLVPQDIQFIFFYYYYLGDQLNTCLNFEVQK